jgi:DNA modification methylase
MSTGYQQFIAAKAPRIESNGIEPVATHPMLFDWQAQIVRWALRKGRAAIFADCGMGKTFMQIEWACQMTPAGKRTLVLAPLSVAQQTIQEAERLGVEITYKPEPDDSTGIWITNYQRLHKFVGVEFNAIALDESSILKSLDGKTRDLLLKEFTSIPYRLCCTATPSPNDLTELGNHAEFLGVSSRRKMLANYFVHDSKHGAIDGYRLKGHARNIFWQWVAQWAVYVRKPSDLGYEDGNFILPPLHISEEIIESNFIPDGKLFADMAPGIQGRTQARKHTLKSRVERASEIIKSSKEQWLVWHDLNDEGRDLTKLLKSKCVLIEGSTDDESRQIYEQSWRGGDVQTLIAKPGMFGFGLNWQHCHNLLYIGLSDSFEKWYHSVRRCWRFGQTHPVNVTVITSDAEISVVENVRRKEKQASELAEGIVMAMRESMIAGVKEEKKARPTKTLNRVVSVGDWTMMLGDCVERIKEIETGSVGFSIFSPPFAKLYCYSDLDADMGNCRSYEEFFQHFKFLIPELLRATMPGRVCAVHAQDIALTLVNDGVMGRKDFTRDISFAFEESGWIYDGRITIDKNPQAQSIRTHAKSLQFQQFEKDSSWSRPCLVDYILTFRAPGVNPVPVKTDYSRDQWTRLAKGCWTDINESDTLNAARAREERDEAHLCPLQLEPIRRCVRLWSNRGELVLSPFAGIGSEGVIALEQERRFIGIELKQSYFKQACVNLRNAVKQESLLAGLESVRESLTRTATVSQEPVKTSKAILMLLAR